MKITRFLETAITLFSILVFGVLLCNNLFFDSYIFAGTNPILSDSNVFLIIPALIIFTLPIYLIVKLRVTSKQTLITIVLINFLAVIGRLIIIISFEIVPTADMYRIVLAGVQIFLYKDFTSLFAGGYVNLFSNQLGVITVIAPFFKMFEFNFNAYYYVNLFLIQGSILLLTFSLVKEKKWKEAILATVLLNIFIPNLFSMFIIYGDLFALFALSGFVFLQSFNLSNKLLNISLTIILVTISMLARPTSIIWFIAWMFLALLYRNFQKLLEIALSITLALIFIQNLPNIYSSVLKIEIPDTSLPNTQFIGIAFEKASIDKESPGFYSDKYFNFHIQNKLNPSLTNTFIFQDVSKNIHNLIQEGRFFDFQTEKIRILWTDPDFETMNFILPMNYALTKNDFRANNALRVGVASEGSHPKNTLGELLVRGMFQLRRFEKVMYLLMLLGAMIASIVNLKSRDKTLLVLQLLGIGFFLFFQFMEIKPRYLLVYMNFLVLHFVYGVAIISEQISSKLKKNP